MIAPSLTITHPNGPPLPLVAFSIDNAIARCIKEFGICTHKKGDAIASPESSAHSSLKIPAQSAASLND
jgi:hypothetical protein